MGDRWGRNELAKRGGGQAHGAQHNMKENMAVWLMAAAAVADSGAMDPTPYCAGQKASLGFLRLLAVGEAQTLSLGPCLGEAGGIENAWHPRHVGDSRLRTG